MRWFRFYSEALSDPKVQLLPGETFKGWLNVLSVINETEPSRGKRSGYLPAHIEDTAYKLYGRDPDAINKTQNLINQLVDAQLLEKKDQKEPRYRAHNWPRRQPVSDDVAARVQTSRRRKAGNGSETLHARNKDRTSTALEREEEEKRSRGDPETDRDGDQDTEEEEDAGAASARRRLRDSHIAYKANEVDQAISESGLDCVLHCVDEAVTYNKPSWAYVETVRRRHRRDGCPDPDLQSRSERIAGRPLTATN